MHKRLDLSKAKVNLGIGSDPGLDPGLTTLGRHTYHTPTHLVTWRSRVLSLTLRRNQPPVCLKFLTSVRSNYETTGLLENLLKCLSFVDSSSIPFPL